MSESATHVKIFFEFYTLQTGLVLAPKSALRLPPGRASASAAHPANPSFFANQPPLAFGIKQAEHPHMTSRAPKMNPTRGALRAARAIQHDASLLKSLPELIDRETGVREILEILQSIIEDQAGAGGNAEPQRNLINWDWH
jgi:hypothetical protein